MEKQPLNTMRSDGEEQRVMEILDRLRTEVKHRELLLKTFFDKGLSSVGKPGLSESEFQALCSLYTDLKNKGRVRWRAFMADMDHQVLESPVTIPQPAPLPPLPTGAVDFHSTTSTEQQKCLDHVLNRLRAKINLRRVLAKPVFQDFDWHNMGYVTCKQFSQCLSFLGLEVSETELELLQVCFKDDKGFNYLKFLAAVQPVQKLEDKYSQRIAKLLSAKDSLKLVAVSPGDPAAKLEEILEKIKIKVSKKRARIHEFMKDYDKLRTGRVSKVNFARGLDLCGFELDPQEVALLQNMYSSPRHPDFVEYLAFSDEIESVFTTKGLEKYPTAEVQVFVPPVEVGLQPFNTEESELFEKAMHRLAEAVRVRRIQLYPLFEDYDRQHIGSITKTQFQRVLSELELAGLLDAREFVLLFQRFDEKVGGRTDINYIAFAEMCYDYAQEKWTES